LFKNVPFAQSLETQLDPTVLGASEYFEQLVTHYYYYEYILFFKVRLPVYEYNPVGQTYFKLTI